MQLQTTVRLMNLTQGPYWESRVGLILGCAAEAHLLWRDVLPLVVLEITGVVLLASW